MRHYEMLELVVCNMGCYRLAVSTRLIGCHRLVVQIG
jgi:hypothetical protein